MSEQRSGETASTYGGLFPALKNLAATLLASGRTRLDLLANEFEEEKLRAVRLLLLTQGAMFCLGLGILFGIGLLALVFHEHAALIIGACSVLFLGLTALLYGAIRSASHRPQRAFGASLAELEEDLRQLKAAVHEETARTAERTTARTGATDK